MQAQNLNFFWGFIGALSTSGNSGQGWPQVKCKEESKEDTCPRGWSCERGQEWEETLWSCFKHIAVHALELHTFHWFSNLSFLTARQLFWKQNIEMYMEITIRAWITSHRHASSRLAMHETRFNNLWEINLRVFSIQGGNADTHSKQCISEWDVAGVMEVILFSGEAGVEPLGNDKDDISWNYTSRISIPIVFKCQCGPCAPAWFDVQFHYFLFFPVASILTRYFYGYC